VNVASLKSLAVVQLRVSSQLRTGWLCCRCLKMSAEASGCFAEWKYSNYFTFLTQVGKNITVKCKLCPREKKLRMLSQRRLHSAKACTHSRLLRVSIFAVCYTYNFKYTHSYVKMPVLAYICVGYVNVKQHVVSVHQV